MKLPTGGGARMRSLRKTALVCLLVLSCPLLKAQRHIAQDMAFIDYLIGNNFTTDALSWLDGNAYQPSDTLAYFRGLSLYTAGKLELASKEFSKVPDSSAFYDRSVFYGVVADTNRGSYSGALSRMDAYQGKYQELKYYQKAGLALLMDEREAFKSASSAFTYSDYSLTEGERLFDKIFAERYLEKHKSPWLAAGLSAVVPGLGKIYVGRKDEGIAALMTVGVLAGFTAEAWIKKGPTDWRTIVFGTLGSLFYIGSIYGSYMSVGIYNDTLKNAQNTAIVFNLHLPVRTLFK